MKQAARLPIDDILPELVSVTEKAGALVLIAAPGAGKTTRVPPALLDCIPQGKIIVLQPRRVAARAAAARISEERGTKLGEETGYIVRHEKRVSKSSRIIVCTEGVFLRQLQEDPLLDGIAAVIFDEFHERNLDSDLALAMVRQIKEEVRPDLKIVVMSATLDAETVVSYLNCQEINSPGRTYPVDIQYLKFQPATGATLETQVVDGILRMLKESDGHVLAFLPGVGEIRRTMDLLESRAVGEDCLIMPLYGDLPLEDQQKVLADLGPRKIVLATNVAETSLTINGVTAVVDSGMARVNRLDQRLGLNQLVLERISRASADQRAGRAGRTAAGVCMRLWTEREHQTLPPFTSPEIERVDLSECALQLLAWGEKDLRSFNWFAKPPTQSLERALDLLEGLDATEDGALTDIGRHMARFPLPPRLARLLIAGIELGELGDTALCAALLAERDPIKRTDKTKDGSGERIGGGKGTVPAHRSDSDVLDRLWAIKEFQEKGHRHTVVGEIVANQAKQIIRAADQLQKLAAEIDADLIKKFPVGKAISESDANFKERETNLRRAIMAAFGDRVCRRRDPKSSNRSALMVGGRGVKLADESAVEDEFFVAVELVETGKSEASARQASAIDKSWLHVKQSVEVIYDPGRQKVTALKRLRYHDLIIEESAAALPQDIDPGEILAAALSADFDPSLVDEEATQFISRVDFLREHLPELNWPQFSEKPWLDILPQWCMGLSSLAELKTRSLTDILQSSLSHEQLSVLASEAPDRISVPSGNRIKIDYERGKPPVLAVRIQEVFGMKETPRLARGRRPVLMHLLAPNYRVQQITGDLASFWKNTYAEVKKDLKARYPKHSWPDDPLTAQAESRPKRKT